MKTLSDLIETYPIGVDEIGTVKDDAQYFYQLDFRQGDAVARVDYKKYSVCITIHGDQHLYYNDEPLVNQPAKYLEHSKHIDIGDACWLLVQVYRKGSCIYDSDDNAEMFSSISETLGYIPRVVRALKSKCMYCGKKHSEKHLQCPICDRGMCDSCYGNDQGTEEQYYDIADSIEDDELYTALLVASKGATHLICHDCVNNTARHLHKEK